NQNHTRQSPPPPRTTPILCCRSALFPISPGPRTLVPARRAPGLSHWPYSLLPTPLRCIGSVPALLLRKPRSRRLAPDCPAPGLRRSESKISCGRAQTPLNCVPLRPTDSICHEYVSDALPTKPVSAHRTVVHRPHGGGHGPARTRRPEPESQE